jgi:hypothetical protein
MYLFRIPPKSLWKTCMWLPPCTEQMNPSQNTALSETFWNQLKHRGSTVKYYDHFGITTNYGSIQALEWKTLHWQEQLTHHIASVTWYIGVQPRACRSLNCFMHSRLQCTDYSAGWSQSHSCVGVCCYRLLCSKPVRHLDQHDLPTLDALGPLVAPLLRSGRYSQAQATQGI